MMQMTPEKKERERERGNEREEEGEYDDGFRLATERRWPKLNAIKMVVDDYQL